MAGTHSRSKGARGERDVVKLLQPVVDMAHKALCDYYSADDGLKIGETPRLQRNSLQSDGGGSDIAGLPWAAIEVKHHASLHVEQWWKQCTEQAKGDQIPILIYRRTGGAWHVRMNVQITVDPKRQPYVKYPADLAIPIFLRWFYKRVMYEAAKAARLV